MGFGSGNFVFLRPCQDGGENRKGRPGSREKEIGFERERERERERDTRLSKNARARARGGVLVA